eukprot:TRINITY_DN733_c0_g1_i17.p1 TRINITY_DN733_c0_g1~~TRINITY_DN733_c0_g1_i17.p1  ORF type:complete len:762 (+),score=243.90 TRINITY_DN733_c0_g1_i17:2140-4425(+)
MNEQSKVNVPMRLKFWRRNNLARGFAALGVVACVATGTWAVEESAKANLGLRGIFPTAAPPELSAEEFAKLDGNWAEWSKGAAAAVADFYAKLETQDAAGQRAALKVLQAKLDVMQRAIVDPRYKSLLGPLTVMHARLAQRVDFAEAALDTLETDPQKVRATKLAEQSKSLKASIAELQTYLGTIQNGTLWLPYVKADAIQKGLATPTDALTATVQAAKEKLAARASITDQKQKDFLSRPAFNQYEAALDQYLAAANWQPPAPNEGELRKQLKDLLDAADNYAVSRSSEDAGKVRTAYSSITKIAPDGGDRISSELQKHILNYNVRIVASEEFLNRLVGESRTERGPVTDFVLGAQVSGNQTTNTKVTFDLLPSGRTARFNLTLNGQIQSNTVGVTSEATVYTQGNHSFVARKEVNFDGVKFVTSPATIDVNPHNTTTGFNVNGGGGLFSGIVNNIASQEIESRRGTAEAIAAQRVRENVLPKFNAEVDKNFAEAGPKLEKDAFSGLKATGLYPDAFLYHTTDSTLRLNSRLMQANEVGADLPATAADVSRGAALLLHESAVNNAVDRMELAGQTLTEPQLKEKLEAFFSKALNRPVKLDAPKEAAAKTAAAPAPAPAADASKDAAEEVGSDDDKGPSAIIFAKEDPMRVHFENGELVLVIRAGFKQEGKDDIPTREITVPITFEVKGNRLLITRGSVRVAAADGEGGGIAINGVVRKKIQSSLPDRNVDSKVELKGPKTVVTTNITGVTFLDGWVQISVN